jgi:Flp pilus assembly pilin Flp
MFIKLKRLTSDQRGASLIEYVLLVGIIALVAIAGFRAFGTSVRDKVQQQSDAVGKINGDLK